MQYEEISIEKGQYLGDIWKFIHTDTVIHKTLPGLGATTLEIECERHSIIIEPYVPVVDGKQAKYPDILGVRSGVSKEHIKAYLLRTDITYKKIIATPEAWTKITGVFQALKIDYKKTYFLLIDECEKLIQDADFRPSINMPLSDFWNFAGKAMISATTLPSLEKRLRSFRHIVLKPAFDYAIPHLLYLTNHIRAAIRDVIGDMQSPGNRFCFFMNSADLIVSIMRMLNIESESKVFGSEAVVAKLERMNYTNAHSKLEALAQYNFFTAKYFSAVDIDEDVKPVVIVVTDVYLSEYTMVDPDTEVVQIMGRFRKGISFGVHITNIRRDLPIRSAQEVKSVIKGRFQAYRVLQLHYMQELDLAVKNAFKEAMNGIKFTQYIYKVGERPAINYFAIDNEIVDERIKGYYQDAALLEQCYYRNPFYNLYVKNKDFTFKKGDTTGKNYETLKDLRREMVDRLEQIMQDGEGTLAEHFSPGELALDKGFIINAYHKLGQATLQALNFSVSKIQLALIEYDAEQGTDLQPVKTMMLQLFKVKEGYWESEIKDNIELINQTLGSNLKASASTLAKYFDLSKRTTIRKRKESHKGYRIIGLSSLV